MGTIYNHGSSGAYSADIWQSPWRHQKHLTITKDDQNQIHRYQVRFGPQALEFVKLDETGAHMSPDLNESCALAWDVNVEDDIIDIFKAIGKALDIYDDQPSQAYKQGYAEGEAKVLREWIESERQRV